MITCQSAPGPEVDFRFLSMSEFDALSRSFDAMPCSSSVVIRVLASNVVDTSADERWESRESACESRVKLVSDM